MVSRDSSTHRQDNATTTLGWAAPADSYKVAGNWEKTLKIRHRFSSLLPEEVTWSRDIIFESQRWPKSGSSSISKIWKILIYCSFARLSQKPCPPLFFLQPSWYFHSRIFALAKESEINQCSLTCQTQRQAAEICELFVSYETQNQGKKSFL